MQYFSVAKTTCAISCAIKQRRLLETPTTFATVCYERLRYAIIYNAWRSTKISNDFFTAEVGSLIKCRQKKNSISRCFLSEIWKDSILVLMNLSIILTKLFLLTNWSIKWTHWGSFQQKANFLLFFLPHFGNLWLRTSRSVQQLKNIFGSKNYPQLVEQNTRENWAVSMDSYREVNCRTEGERAWNYKFSGESLAS